MDFISARVSKKLDIIQAAAHRGDVDAMMFIRDLDINIQNSPLHRSLIESQITWPDPSKSYNNS
jgi:hypothetical protein